MKNKKPHDVKQVIVVRKDLNMRKGKLAAQVAHASMKFLFENNDSERNDELVVKLSPQEALWANESFTKVVCYVETEKELRELMVRADIEGVECYPIVDAGRTEFHGVPTLTCVSFGPDESPNVDKVTGHLKLL